MAVGALPLSSSGAPRLLVLVVAVAALDLERAARAGELVAHLLEEALEGGLVGGADQSGAKLVPGVVAASARK